MRTLKIYSWLFFVYLFSILSLMHVVCVSCQCLESERYHLLQLKAGLKVQDDGQYSDEILVNWNNQSWDCCQWSGVGCSEDGKVVRLDLSGQGITEGVNDLSSLFSLKYLERLNLAENNFNSTFPAKFDEFSNLNYLNLSHSGFSGQIPIGISRLKNLQTLHISNANYYSTFFGYGSSSLKLENPNLDTLIRNLSNLQELLLVGVNISAKDDNWGRVISSSLPNLRVLSLSGCDLKGSIDWSLSNLRHLLEIRLSDNDLRGVFPQEMFHLPSLRAIDLSLNNNHRGSFPEISKNNSLEELVLAGTGFSGGLPYAIIGNLKSLSILDIGSCRFSGAIPKSLSNLTKLTYLDLSENFFVGSIPSFTWLSNLTDLRIQRNPFLNGSIHSTYWEGLTKLESLNLADNSLRGSIPVSMFRAPSLNMLHLSNNQFNDISNELLNMSSSSSQLSYIHLHNNVINGPFPYFVVQFTQLSDLDLSGNNFSGPLPDFSSLQKLENLDLSSNKFNGPFPNSLLKCENLSYLELSHNSFSGMFNSSMINQFQLLKSIDLSYNGFSFVDDSIDVPFSLPYLKSVSLASCGLRSFPSFLRNLSVLDTINLSMNQISGEIPNWIWDRGSYLLNLSHNFLEDMGRSFHDPSIQFLYLHSNRLQGELPFFPTNARQLDYSMNNFSSNIPHLIPGSDLTLLSLSNNNFNGSIPESICNISGIHVLDLSNNSLTGSIPQCISMLTEESLEVLNLGMNNLNGTISDALFQAGCQLETLDLNGNRLSGKVPESLENCKSLQVLNLGNNEIDDTFPCWLKEISSLSVLVLRSNNFHGELGCPETKATWPMLQIVDLSSNSFSGTLSAELFRSWKGMINVTRTKAILHVQVYAFYYQDVVTLSLKGNEVKLEKILTIFTCIDLSSNNFEGVIPQELGDLKALHGLNLTRNNLWGKIPASLGSLKQLESLDLSKNKLSGAIPQQLADLNFLQVLNLSFNQLEGRIPTGSQFDNLCEDSFLGNKGLVGPQVNRKCKVDGETVPSPPTALHDNNTRPKKSEVRWELIGAEVGFTVGLGIVIGSLIFWQRWREWYFDRIDQVLLRLLCHRNQGRRKKMRRKAGN